MMSSETATVAPSQDSPNWDRKRQSKNLNIKMSKCRTTVWQLYSNGRLTFQ